MVTVRQSLPGAEIDDLGRSDSHCSALFGLSKTCSLGAGAQNLAALSECQTSYETGMRLLLIRRMTMIRLDEGRFLRIAIPVYAAETGV